MPSSGQILANSRGHLASYKLPQRILLVDVVRRARNGEADYGWAREHARASLGLDGSIWLTEYSFELFWCSICTGLRHRSLRGAFRVDDPSAAR